MENQEENTIGVTGTYTADGIPRGSTSLTPFLAIKNAANAVEFYRDVFGARFVDCTEIGGVMVHADLDFGNGKLQLGEPSPDYGLVAPPEPPSACYSMALYCSNVDELVARGQAAGATVREPAATFVSGDRFASIIDPFGVRWSLLSRVIDLSEDESRQRVARWAAEQQR